MEEKLQDALSHNYERTLRLSKRIDKSQRKVIAEAEIKLARNRVSKAVGLMLKQ